MTTRRARRIDRPQETTVEESIDWQRHYADGSLYVFEPGVHFSETVPDGERAPIEVLRNRAHAAASRMKMKAKTLRTRTHPVTGEPLRDDGAECLTVRFVRHEASRRPPKARAIA